MIGENKGQKFTGSSKIWRSRVYLGPQILSLLGLTFITVSTELRPHQIGTLTLKILKKLVGDAIKVGGASREERDMIISKLAMEISLVRSLKISFHPLLCFLHFWEPIIFWALTGVLHLRACSIIPPRTWTFQASLCLFSSRVRPCLYSQGHLVHIP